MAEQSCRSQRLAVYFSGTVQGVGFRYAAVRLSEGFAVSGFVSNLSDGRVQLVVEGQMDEIRRFVEEIRLQMGDYISNVEETVAVAEGCFRGFEVRF